MNEDIFLFDNPEYLDGLDAIRYRLPCPIKGCGWVNLFCVSNEHAYRLGVHTKELVERRMILDARQHLQYDHDLWQRCAAEQEIQIDLRSSGIYYDKHSNRYYGPYPT